MCGRDLTEYLMTRLNKEFPDALPIDTPEKRAEAYDVAIKIKHMHGQVAHDFDAELKTSKDESTHIPKRYKLPGSQTITVNSMCLECPEILFAPKGAEENLDGIHQFTYNAIMKCDRDI